MGWPSWDTFLNIGVANASALFAPKMLFLAELGPLAGPRVAHVSVVLPTNRRAISRRIDVSLPAQHAKKLFSSVINFVANTASPHSVSWQYDDLFDIANDGYDVTKCSHN